MLNAYENRGHFSVWKELHAAVDEQFIGFEFIIQMFGDAGSLMGKWRMQSIIIIFLLLNVDKSTLPIEI